MLSPMTNQRIETLRQALAAGTLSSLDELEYFVEIDSTNRFLLDQPVPTPGNFRVTLADYQTAGRGRLGRAWCSPPKASVCLSIACAFREVPRHFPALSLAIGVAVVELLHSIGVEDAALKWPNDIFVGDAKLGGILIETRAGAKASAAVVVGLGLNLDFSGYDPDTIAPDRPWPITHLRQCLVSVPAKLELEGKLIDAICHALAQFEAHGFSSFIDGWNRSDWLRGRETTVDTANGRIRGTAEGIDDDGALLLMTGQGRQRIHSGSIVLPPPGATT